MAYSFVQIEKDKSRTILLSFLGLVFFYFISLLIIVLVCKYFLFRFAISYTDPLPFVALLDWPLLTWTFIGAGLAGVFHWQMSTRDLIGQALSLMQAAPASIDDARQKMFRNIVEEAQVATGGKFRIEPFVVPVAALNAFALQDFEGRSVIGLTHGLLSRLSREQIEAVVAHEAGHIACGDCLSTTVTSVIFRVFDNVCDAVGLMLRATRLGRGKRNADGYFLLLVVVFLLVNVFRFLGFLGSLFISREREYRADALAVRLTRNPLALAEALFIITHRWKGTGLPGQGMEAIFIQNPVRQAIDDQDGFFPELFSTHPPVRKRIAILLDMVRMTETDLEQSIQQNIQQSMSQSTAEPQVPFATGNVDSGVFAVSSGRSSRDTCPRCHVPLTTSFYEEVPVLFCVQCQGFLIKEPDVLRILERRGQAFSPVIQERARTIFHQPLPARPWGGYMGFDEQSILCPSCADAAPRMVRRFVNPRYTVEIDRCRSCGQVWFDRDELELLQCIYEQDRSVPV